MFSETDRVGFGRFAHQASGSTNRLHQSQCHTEDITDFCCSKWTTILTHFGTELSHFHRLAESTRLRMTTSFAAAHESAPDRYCCESPKLASAAFPKYESYATSFPGPGGAREPGIQ